MYKIYNNNNNNNNNNNRNCVSLQLLEYLAQLKRAWENTWKKIPGVVAYGSPRQYELRKKKNINNDNQ